MIVRFVVPGAVRGKGRPRFVRATGRTYTPEQTMSYENRIAAEGERAMAGRDPLQGALGLRIWVLKTVPASWSKARREAADYVTSKPDLDNVVKLVKDAMNKIVYDDDAQIASLIAVKRYGDTEQLLVEVVTL